MPRSKRTRLTDSPEFERVYRQGQARRGKLFSVHSFPNDLGVARLGTSVSKKVGNAVTRNAVRRKLREMFRSMDPELLGDRDIVISVRPQATDSTFEDLQLEFRRLLEKMDRPEHPRKV